MIIIILSIVRIRARDVFFSKVRYTNETTRPADTRWPRGFFSPESTGVHILGLHKRSRTAAWNNYKNVVYCRHDDDNIANLRTVRFSEDDGQTGLHNCRRTRLAARNVFEPVNENQRVLSEPPTGGGDCVPPRKSQIKKKKTHKQHTNSSFA